MTKRITKSLGAVAVAAALLAAASCISRQPMTESEFIGFCSTTNRRGACDSLGLCQEYLRTVGQPQKSLEACLAGCDTVQKDLNRADSIRCGGTIRAGNDWCQRYCRTLYPE